MIASIKSKLFSQTWTCPMFPSMPRPRLQLNMFIPRELMNYLLMMPLLTTLMVTKRLLLLKAKSKLKEKRHVHLMGTRRLKKGMMKTCSSAIVFIVTSLLCVLSLFVYTGKLFLFLPSPLFLGVCKQFAFHRLLTYWSLFLPFIYIYIYIPI